MVIMKFLRILVILFFTGSIFSEKINLDQIIAIAGDGIIMESQFLEAKETYLKNYKAANVDRPLPPEKFLEEQILENLIIQELQIQRAFKAGVRISDQELNESMSLLAANNKLSLVDFKKEIEETIITKSGLKVNFLGGFIGSIIGTLAILFLYINEYLPIDLLKLK